MNQQELKQQILDTGFFEDNEYLDKYVCLLFSNNLEKHIKRYSQRHHAIPKCVFKKLGLPVDNSKDNLFELKFSLHILSHIYLSLCSIDTDIRRSNAVAYKWMASGKLTDQVVQEICEEDLSAIQILYEKDLSLCGENHPMYGVKRPDLAEYNRTHIKHMSGEKNAMFGKKGCLSPAYGRKHTEEEKKKMRDSWNYEQHVTEQFLQKQRDNFKRFNEQKTGLMSKEARIKAIESRRLHGKDKLTEETKRKLSLARGTPIYCITTGIHYTSYLDAEQKTGLDRKLISKNCRGKIPYVKYHKSKNHYYDDIEYVFIFDRVTSVEG